MVDAVWAALTVVRAFVSPERVPWYVGAEASDSIRSAAGAWIGGLHGFVAALRADLLPWVLRRDGRSPR